MYSKKEIIVIIDAFNNGINYAPIFSGFGFPCIHIHSNYDYFKDRPWGKEFFIKNLIFTENNIDQLINEVKKYKVKAVIPGQESGVYLADIISDRFDVLKNDLSTTKARRNKFVMIDTLKNKGMPCAKQICSNNLQDFINWYRSSGFKKVVLKPIFSNSSDGVKICTNESEIEAAFHAIFRKINFMGILNETLVLQEYLSGPEYIVNSVSCQGKHFITDVWLGIGGIEDTISTDEYAEMVRKDTPQYHTLQNYVKQALDALGIENGPSHAEIKYTASGPKLIEIGSRLAGLFDFSVIQKCLGYSQLSVAVETYLNPELFMERIAIYEKLPQKAFMRFIYFNSTISGFINKEPKLEEFLKLDSMESIKFVLKQGDFLNVTNNIIGRPGYASMLSTNMENLEKDYARFRKLEKNFYNQLLK